MTTDKVATTLRTRSSLCGEAYPESIRSGGMRALLGEIGLLDVRPGKVDYSSGCESRPSKVGQPLGSELWAGGSNPKG